MQHTPSQDSSDGTKTRTVVRCLRKVFAFAVARCLQWRAFAIERPLASKCPCLFHQRAFAFKVPLPLPPKGFCHRRAFAIERPLSLKDLCHRRAFAFKVPLPLPSKGNYHRREFAIELRAFAIEWPLQSKGFAFKVPMLCHRTAFGFKVSLSLPSKGLCHPRAFAIKVPLPLASKGLFLEANSPHIMCIKLHRCNILLPTV
jgi:hypothetical protein